MPKISFKKADHMLIYQALCHDHDRIKDLLHDLSLTQSKSQKRKEVIRNLKREMTLHTRAEELVLFKTLKEKKDENLKELILTEGYGQHIIAENMLNDLLDRGSEEIDELIPTFINMVNDQINHEEILIFRTAKHYISTHDAIDMTLIYKETKSKIQWENRDQKLNQFIQTMFPTTF